MATSLTLTAPAPGGGTVSESIAYANDAKAQEFFTDYLNMRGVDTTTLAGRPLMKAVLAELEKQMKAEVRLYRERALKASNDQTIEDGLNLNV